MGKYYEDEPDADSQSALESIGNRIDALKHAPSLRLATSHHDAAVVMLDLVASANITRKSTALKLLGMVRSEFKTKKAQLQRAQSHV